MKYSLFFLLSCTALYANPAPFNTPTTVKIGVNMELSGYNSNNELSDSMRDAMLIAQKELNERPNTPFRYEILFEDNQRTPRGANLATNKLLSIDKVDALISIFDYAVAPAIPLATQKKTAHLGYGWGADRADGKYNFVFGSSELAYAAAYYSEIKKHPGPVAMLIVRQSATPAFVNEMNRLFKADGKAAPATIFFNSDDADFRTLLLKLRETGAKQVVMMVFGSDLDKFLYQYKQLGKDFYSPQFYGLGAIRYANDRAAVAGWIAAGNAPLPESFISTFKAKSKAAPNEYAGGAYDGVKMIATAAEEELQGSFSIKEKIARELGQMKSYEGICGNYEQSKGNFDHQPALYRLTVTGEEKLP